MNNDPNVIRSQRYEEIGTLIRSSAPEVIDIWMSAARREQDSAKSAHREELRNHLPLFLEQLGAELVSRGTQREQQRDAAARSHGEHRWEHGWQLDEVVRDYQLLRIVLIDHLDSTLSRKLNLEEIKAIGLLLDDAIEDAVVTYVRQQEKFLSETEHRSRGTFENAAVGIGHIDLEGRWIRANGRLCSMLGYTLDEVNQTTIDRCADAEDVELLLGGLEELRNGSVEHFPIEMRLVARTGQKIWTNTTVSLHRSLDDAPLHYIAVIQDITDRRRLDDDLQRAMSQAEQANRLKSEFVANVSHEIRTPMNAILGLTELALDEELSDEVRDFINTAHDSAGVLLSLVNDLLDFSRIEAGRLELESSQFDLWDVIDDTAKTLSVSAADKGLELLTDVADDVPGYIKGDPLRLRQVLTNLVSNAIKFTERGEVLVTVRLQSETDQQTNVRFSVIDTGIGISPENKQRIFAPFTQADASTTRVFGGSGLGLAICAELISQFGGELDVESEVGKGSHFYFTARFEKADQPQEPAESDQFRLEQLREKRVLIVDDNATNRMILESILKPISMYVDSVDDGEAALNRLRLAAEVGTPYNIVLIDALMPGKDGFSISDEINADERLVSTTVLMLSSGDRSAFSDRVKTLKVDAFLDKPVNRRELLKVIATATFGDDTPDVDSAVAPAVPPPSKVLVVEDTPANQKVVQAILRKRGHIVTLANNGREAIEKAQSEPFDVVLMDVQMPTVDGYQATSAIRESEDDAVAQIPIIAMTAHAMKGGCGKVLRGGHERLHRQAHRLKETTSPRGAMGRRKARKLSCCSRRHPKCLYPWRSIRHPHHGSQDCRLRRGAHETRRQSTIACRYDRLLW